MTRQADFKRRVRGRMLKTGESYAVARSHVLAGGGGGGRHGGGRVLHVTNGDMTVPALRETVLGEVMAWRDVLHEGPVPAVPDVELRRIRADFLGGVGAGDVGTLAEFTARDRMLEDFSDGEYVLWFEADLYDQLQLIQILAKLGELAVAPSRITLVCIGEHVGIAHFGGLGDLDAERLGRLPAIAAQTMTASSLAHAAQAWHVFRATDPSGLGEIAAHPSSELRFVAEAFDRLSREYPSTRDGLALTERRILAAIAGGTTTAGAAFARAAAKEARPFLGDSWCFDRMTRFARAATPLLAARRDDTTVRTDTELAAHSGWTTSAQWRHGQRHPQRHRSLDRRNSPRRTHRRLALARTN